jgi:hypothetical protein
MRQPREIAKVTRIETTRAHGTSSATRGSMAATMDHSSIRGLATALQLCLAGLPRSENADHRIGCPLRIIRGDGQ